MNFNEEMRGTTAEADIVEDTSMSTENEQAVNLEKTTGTVDEEADVAQDPVASAPDSAASGDVQPEDTQAADPAPRRGQTEAGKIRDIVRQARQEDMDQGKIVSIDGGRLRESTSTEAGRVLKTAQEIWNSYRNKQKLTAMITEVITPKGLPPVPVAKYNEFRILFDPADFVRPESLSGDGQNRNNQIRGQLQRRIGGEVEFIVTGIESIQEAAKDPNSTILLDPSNRVVRGSRKAALKKDQDDSWFTENPRRAPKVQVGSRVEAQISMVRPQVLTVVACGVEIDIPVRNVSDTFIADLTQDRNYSIGGTVVIQITDIHIEDGEVLADAVVQGKQIQKKEAARIAQLLAQGNTISEFGEIVRINDLGTLVTVRLESGATCRCNQNATGDRALVGDQWLIKVNYANPENGRIGGFLTHFIR